MLSTPLCALLGIDHPVLNAPMSGTATADLAAAVSLAGGFGMLGGTNPAGPDWLRAQIRVMRARTDRPFGVGFISSFLGLDDLVQVALEARVAADVYRVSAAIARPLVRHDMTTPAYAATGMCSDLSNIVGPGRRCVKHRSRLCFRWTAEPGEQTVRREL